MAAREDGRARPVRPEGPPAGPVQARHHRGGTWDEFIEQGPSSIGSYDEAGLHAHHETFEMGPDDTAASLLAAYERVAERTSALIAGLPHLDLAQPLPQAPWFTPGATWSARRALRHIIAETAPHAGHADIIRESLDGAKTMG